jgi:mono/diheme cytochrome c family protein
MSSGRGTGQAVAFPSPFMTRQGGVPTGSFFARSGARVFKPAAIAISTFAAAVATFGATLTFAPQHAAATSAYAQQTGKACGSCHVSKSGGGALTKAGKAFQKSRK